MFYETFKDLCKVKNIKPTHVVQELGLSSANMSNWKSGRNPKTDILNRIADYFDVSVDYLLGNEPKENPAANSDEALRFALYGSDSQDITKEMLDEIREIAAIKREMNRRKNGTK
ncbi:MAG: hypothetical protein E7561_05220 [Ruminococcaceae bacterium]|nr:hypothetical protein [Oscillospiraceae bacterium]